MPIPKAANLNEVNNYKVSLYLLLYLTLQIK